MNIGQELDEWCQYFVRTYGNENCMMWIYNSFVATLCFHFSFEILIEKEIQLLSSYLVCMQPATMVFNLDYNI